MKKTCPHLIILLSSQLSTFALEHFEGQPYGIEMCKQGIKRIVGMKSYRFQLIQLTCYFFDEPCPEKASEEDASCKNVNKVNFNCSPGSKIIETLKNKKDCATVSGTTGHQTDWKTDVKLLSISSPRVLTKMFKNTNRRATTKTYLRSVQILYGEPNTVQFLLFQKARNKRPLTMYMTKNVITNMAYFSSNQVFYWTRCCFGRLLVYNLSSMKEKIVINNIVVLDGSQGEHVLYVLGKKRKRRKRSNCKWCIWKVDSSLKPSLLGYNGKSVNQIAVSAKVDRIYLSNNKQYIIIYDVSRNVTSSLTTGMKVQILMMDKIKDILYYASEDKLIRVDTCEIIFKLNKTILSLRYFRDSIFIFSRTENEYIKFKYLIEGYNHKDMKIDPNQFRTIRRRNRMFFA